MSKSAGYDYDSDYTDDEQDNDRSDIENTVDSQSDEEVSDLEIEEEDSDSDSDSDIDPWQSFVVDAFDNCQQQFQDKVRHLTDEGFTEKAARREAYLELLPVYRKTVIDKLVERLIWFKALTADPLYKSIKTTAKRIRIRRIAKIGV